VVYFSDMSIEKHVLALLFQSPFHIRTGSMDMSAFSKTEHRTLAELIRSFVQKNKSTPSHETLKSYSNEYIKSSKSIDDVSEALLLLDTLPTVEASEAEYYFKKMENYRVGRAMHALYESFGQQLQDEIDIDFMELRKDVFKKTLHMGADEDHIERGFIYDNVKKRALAYRDNKSGDSKELIPYGIESLDKALGKMKKKSLNLIYSKTGGGKTVFAINLAYNAAVRGFNVMYFTAEISKDAIESKFDSLIGELDSLRILQGTMSSDEEKRYKIVLEKQLADKPPLWVTHIPVGCNMGTIIQEIEMYTTSNGYGPDLVVLDYANLIEPTKKPQDRSAKFDNLLKEMHDYAGFYNYACITMMQESRTAALNDVRKNKKAEDEDVDGVHNIGLSHHAADHCEVVLRLKWRERDLNMNRLKVSIDKNRFGPANLTLELFANFAITYIGDAKQIIVYKLSK